MLSEAEMVKFRRAVESTYTGVCDICEYVQEKDAAGITRCELKKTAENIPCRLSYSNKTSAAPSDTAAQVSQTVKLFLAPDITVREGSKIIVTQDGRTREFHASGIPAVWFSHQEIMLVDCKELA